jgi:transglycosylase-like protein with SLT domain
MPRYIKRFFGCGTWDGADLEHLEAARVAGSHTAGAVPVAGVQRFAFNRRGTATIRTMRACFVLALSLILPGTPSALGQADAQPDQMPAERVAPQPSPASGDSICLMIESAARANGLPVDYFARVIWQESHFQPDVVGPRTRNGQRAQGIAQFMPGTAAERRAAPR